MQLDWLTTVLCGLSECKVEEMVNFNTFTNNGISPTRNLSHALQLSKMTAPSLESTQSEPSRTSKARIRLRDMIPDHIE